MPSPRSIGSGLVLLGAAGLLLWAVLTVVRRNEAKPERSEPPGRSQEETTPGAGSPPGDAEAAPKPAPTGPAETNPSWDALLDSLTRAATAAEARAKLDALHAYLLALDPTTATDLIRNHLAGGEDSQLPLQFAIGADSFLKSPPTLRVALLDILGEIDPVAAAQIGREVLETPTSADEWAVSLRNVARGEEGDDANTFLREKTEELIRMPQWQAKPTIGYLNAFDVLVHTRATDSTPLLSELIRRKDRRDLSHAGFLTLDRLTQRAPLTVLKQLQQDRALQQSHPAMVAQQFARADLREPDQRELVRSWLLDPVRTQTELQAFAGIFPNNNQMISRNLLTREEQVPGAALLEHDRDVLAIVSQWQQEPSFEAVRPHLATMAGRLTTFIRQASP